ncbi:peptidyl-prolyl cis-trans isomerase E [Stomoxys calcitrans]|uniref:peptidyl-prolyl cis-trans isomerase E n=1 Tax=Stomoxys calcitrans TaxID=35570 RepID=UPI0027E29283|nr:peptidyl-prolyl cis-trans isomerase E [Stomoxys calcitrans]
MSRKISHMDMNPKYMRAFQIAHKKSIANAQSKVDMKPTKLMTNTFLNVNKLKDDFMASKRILDSNIQLLRRINHIQRTHGKIDNYNKYKGQRSTYLERANKRIEEIQKENLALGCRLLKVKSSLDTRRSEGLLQMKRHPIRLNDNMVIAYMSATHIPERSIMEALLRPHIYLDLYVKNLRPLGRLNLLLYAEACPDLVLEFVRICTYHASEKLQFMRIFPSLWIEGKLMVENSALHGKHYEYSHTESLNHSQNIGVLSFSSNNLKGFPSGCLSFTISFKTLPISQNERIPFGVISNGLKILNSLPDYGSKNGKTKKEIIVVDCGVL